MQLSDLLTFSIAGFSIASLVYFWSLFQVVNSKCIRLSSLPKKSMQLFILLMYACMDAHLIKTSNTTNVIMAMTTTSTMVAPAATGRADESALKTK